MLRQLREDALQIWSLQLCHKVRIFTAHTANMMRSTFSSMELHVYQPPEFSRWRLSTNSKPLSRDSKSEQSGVELIILVDMIISFLVLALVSVVTALEIFDWDCTNSLGTCNNACFAIKCKNIPGTLTYDSDMAARNPRRTLSGCNRTPCTTTDYDQFGNSCDEYPFASTTEGGEGAILRCVDESENSSKCLIF